MQLKNKSKRHAAFDRFESSAKKFSAVQPEIVNMDQLGVLTDDELLNRFRTLEDERERALSSGDDPVVWEVEIAYARREFQLRRIRHNQHDQYLQDLEREAREAQKQEERYPVADLDNSAFIFN